MNKKTIIITIFLFCGLFLSAAEVVFWCTADLHGTLSGGTGSMSKLAFFLEHHRNQGDITVDAGDLLQGSFEANTTKGAMIVKAFNKIGYDFFVPGNHDLEFGAEVLRRNLANMNTAVLCANFKFRNPLAKMKPYAVIERNSMRIGIIGTGDRESRCRMLPCDEISFADEEKSIARCLRELRREKVDMIVLVRHGGIYFSGGSLYTMLKKFPEIDLVIGAHSHQLERGRKIAGAYYVQPGAFGEGVIEVKVDFDDSTRRIRRISSQYHLIGKYPDSRNFNEFFNGNPVFRSRYSKFSHDFLSSGGNMKDIQKYLIEKSVRKRVNADAYLFFVDESSIEWRNMLNGYILYRMFPFENSVVTLNVNAAEYKKIVEECRKYSQKYKIEMLLLPSDRKYIKLCTSAFVLSGGGRNFPESRRIAEKNKGTLKEHQSLRSIVKSFLQSK